MTTTYVMRTDTPSFFSRLGVRVKLLILFLASTLIFVWQNVFYLGAMLAVLLVLVVNARIDLSLIKRLFMLMIPFLGIVFFVQGFFNPYGVTPLFTVPEWVPLIGGELSLKWEGVVYALLIALRLFTPLIAFPLVVMTTDVNDLVVGLVRLRVPFKIAFIFSIALRFVPLIFSKINAIMDAQRLRGLALEKMSFFRRIPVFAGLLVPLIIGSLMKAQTLDVALQSKAFSGRYERTFYNENAFPAYGRMVKGFLQANGSWFPYVIVAAEAAVGLGLTLGLLTPVAVLGSAVLALNYLLLAGLPPADKSVYPAYEVEQGQLLMMLAISITTVFMGSGCTWGVDGALSLFCS